MLSYMLCSSCVVNSSPYSQCRIRKLPWTVLLGQKGLLRLSEQHTSGQCWEIVAQHSAVERPHFVQSNSVGRCQRCTGQLLLWIDLSDISCVVACAFCVIRQCAALGVSGVAMLLGERPRFGANLACYALGSNCAVLTVLVWLMILAVVQTLQLE